MFGKALNEISIEDIETVVQNKIPESRTLDYKLKVHPDGDAGNKEFLRDVSAFANTVGGYLIYGVEEKAGIPTAIKGVEVDNPDKLQLRFESLLRTGVDPPIRGVVPWPVDCADSKKKIIVVQVPKSVGRPHVVKIKGHFRFYGRNSSGVHPLEVDDLRRAFLASETLATRIRTFRNDRIAQIASGQMPIPMQPGAKVVLHLIPESAFELGKKCNLSKKLVSNVKLMGTSQCLSHGYNYDGHISHDIPGQSRLARRYTQVFHNGIIEAVDISILDHGKQNRLSYLEQEAVKAFDTYLGVLGRINAEFPVWTALSLLGVRGCEFDLLQSTGMVSIEYHPIDQNELIIPEVYVEHPGLSGKEVLRPSFDRIRNACGLEGMS